MFLSFLVLMLSAMLWMSVHRLFRRRLKKDDPSAANRCPCGYPLSHLDTLRCPECGRVAGFNVTAEELGLTATELRHAQEVRDRRTQHRT